MQKEQEGPAATGGGEELAVADPAVPQRHQLTLLFTDLSGSTRLGRTLEPEEYAAVMAATRAIWRRAAARHGGRIVRSQGDGALIMFGYPELREDDGRRAVEAALEIHEDVGELDLPAVPAAYRPLLMHSGIHAGVLLLTDGDMERGLFDLTGDVPNTAAHLAAAAGEGQILASLAALGPHEHLFDVGRVLDPVAGLPGTAVRVVLGRSGLRRRFDATVRRGLTPMIGREAAWRELDVFAAAQVPGSITIVGEPGIGKTRLLEEFLMRSLARGEQTLCGHCDQHAGAELLQPFAQVVRAYFGLSARIRLSEAGDEIRGALGAFQGRSSSIVDALLQFLVVDPPARVKPARMRADLIAFFESVCATQRLTLLLDDWQWADDATVQLLAAIEERPSRPRIVLATRPDPAELALVRGSATLRLHALQEHESAAAVRRWLPYADPFVCSQIHRYSGGIPLFIEELCHSASVGQLAKDIERATGSRNWLATLAVSRLNRLPQALATIVRAAAVAGTEVPLKLLGAVLGRVPAPGELRALAEAGFLEFDETDRKVRFRHGITREAIHDSIGLEARRVLHGGVLHALLQESRGPTPAQDVEALAYHSRGAGRWHDAAEHAERAGDKASAAFALDRARLYYQQALEALDRVHDESTAGKLRWCQLATKYGMTCVFDPLPLAGDAGVFELAVRKARSLGHANTVARAEYWLAYILYAMGRFRESRIHVQLALDAAVASGDQPLVDQVEATKGEVLAAMSDPGAIAWIDEAVRRKAEGAQPGQRDKPAIGSAYALACKGGLLAHAGGFNAAHACFERAIGLLGASGHPVGNSVRNWISVAYNWHGQWEPARRVAAESERIASNTRALLLLAAARANLGYADWREQGSEDGLWQLDEAMRWMEERGNGFFTSIYHGWLMAAWVERGDFDRARAHGVRVFRRARQGERFGEATACRCMAWIADARGDASGAQRWLARARSGAERRGSTRDRALNEWVAAQLAWSAGRQAAARQCIETAVVLFGELAMHDHAARAARPCGAGSLQALLD